MLDPEWPEPLPAAAVYGSRAAKRLALAAARRERLTAPARQIARERRALLFHLRLCRAIREGLTALGLDPARSELLTRNEARVTAELAALPPAENDPPEPPSPPVSARSGPALDPWARNLLRQAKRFEDPAAAPPDLAKESLFTLLAFVLARSPRHGLVALGVDYASEGAAAGAEGEADTTAPAPSRSRDSADTAETYRILR